LKHPVNSLKTTVFYLVLAMVLTACNPPSVFSTITLQPWRIPYLDETNLDVDADI